MVPHPETLCRLGELEYEELLRDTAQQRRAASAEARSGLRPMAVRAALVSAASWLTGAGARARGATAVRAGSPLSGGSVHMARHVG